MELYRVLVELRIATGKIEFDIWENMLYKEVTTRVAKQIKSYNLRKLGNFTKISRMSRDMV